MRSRSRSVLACVPLMAVLTAAAEPFRLRAVSAGQRGFLGLLVVRDGQILEAQDASRLFTPASVIKLVVAATALHHLGPEHRLDTVLASSGMLEGGTLTGDLVLRGSGDPTWSRRFFPEDPRAPLRRLASQARAAGLRRVEGRLLVDAGAFPGPAHPRSRTFAERAAWYGAPVSSVAVEENVISVGIAAGPAPGLPIRAPDRVGPFSLLNRAVTVGPDRDGRGNVEFYSDPERGSLVVRGEYPLGEPAYEPQVSVPSPELLAGQALAFALRAEGIEITGGIELGTPAEAEPQPLARIQSPPVSEILVPILQNSHNWYAEMLLRSLALRLRGEGRLDLGLEIERDFLIQQVGVPADAFFLDDASGLSHQNLLSPEAVVALLDHVRRQSWRDAFVSALASPGHGTLRGAGDLPPMRAKTGTLAGTLGLAGYMHLESPQPILFAVFLNHRPSDRGLGPAEIAGRLRRWWTR
jgi:D-alanyl-D-alanine carboxypeptidase/D-alanyl-D-alanine-endopeptidase (penicillin-binding protein 4)